MHARGVQDTRVAKVCIFHNLIVVLFLESCGWKGEVRVSDQWVYMAHMRRSMLVAMAIVLGYKSALAVGGAFNSLHVRLHI